MGKALVSAGVKSIEINNQLVVESNIPGESDGKNKGKRCVLNLSLLSIPPPPPFYRVLTILKEYSHCSNSTGSGSIKHWPSLMTQIILPMNHRTERRRTDVLNIHRRARIEGMIAPALSFLIHRRER